ncbi:hypothetical protein [Arthrobacter sp. StoSoilB13]|uniref:hypothetical protein n=1 Tax=Arthrobacter sp. StoSoilB13 TaxID=2830993 RepID=UPI001CC3B0BF|nr:hypothetical protein [Arthrobacter sp. StoSoilB13]BCW48666.1 hypothetical protein StoSoilB13_10080 [Arthrobacter sp. StoSoilB13]
MKTILLADVAVIGDRSCGCIPLMDRRGRSSELNMDGRKAKKAKEKPLEAFLPEIGPGHFLKTRGKKIGLAV